MPNGHIVAACPKSRKCMPRGYHPSVAHQLARQHQHCNPTDPLGMTNGHSERNDSANSPDEHRGQTIFPVSPAERHLPEILCTRIESKCSPNASTRVYSYRTKTFMTQNGRETRDFSTIDASLGEFVVIFATQTTHRRAKSVTCDRARYRVIDSLRRCITFRSA